MGTTEFQIFTATVAHAAALARAMRTREVEEVFAATGLDAYDVILQDLRRSALAFTAFINGEVAAMWGAIPCGGRKGVGFIWMHTTEVSALHSRLILKHAKRQLERLLESFPLLVNQIRATSEVSLRWAKWLGFELEPVGDRVNIHIRRR